MVSRRLQNVIAAVVILLALIALIYQRDIADYYQRLRFQSDQRPVIAQIESLSRGVKYRAPESLTYYDANQGLGLHAKDTVSTNDKSSAVITFKSGLKIELQPNSLIIIEDDTANGGNLELSFLRGQVKVLNDKAGKKVKLPTFEIEKQQAIKEAPVKLDLAFLEKAPTPRPVENVPQVVLEEKKERPKPTPIKKKIVDELKEVLPDGYIASVIRNQRTFLNRCYAQHLRLNPDARGRIDTSLTIEADGSISTARVISSTIPDPVLQQCVVATLQRAHFKPFKGDPVIVTYPINFE